MKRTLIIILSLLFVSFVIAKSQFYERNKEEILGITNISGICDDEKSEKCIKEINNLCEGIDKKTPKYKACVKSVILKNKSANENKIYIDNMKFLVRQFIYRKDSQGLDSMLKDLKTNNIVIYKSKDEFGDLIENLQNSRAINCMKVIKKHYPNFANRKIMIFKNGKILETSVYKYFKISKDDEFLEALN